MKRGAGDQEARKQMAVLHKDRKLGQGSPASGLKRFRVGVR